MSDELKPCPWCGKAPTLHYSDITEEWHVYCYHGDCMVSPYVFKLTKAEAIAAWNTRADEPVECYCIDGKCSRCGKDLPEPGYTGYEYEGSYCPTCGAKVRKDSENKEPSLKESTEDTQALSDSRERLEADVYQAAEEMDRFYCGEKFIDTRKIIAWLNRQAAITEHEVKLRELYKFEENHRANIDATEEVNRKLNERIAELTAELETYRKYTEQGECEKLQSEKNGDTREQLEADVHRAIFQWGWDSEWSRNEHRINECVVRSWLNRQAAITERECREQPCNNISCSIALGNQNLIAENRELHKHVDNLTAERDKLQCERNAAISRASYIESAAAEELAKLLGENETIEVYDDKIHGKRRLVTGTQRKLEKQIAELTAERDDLRSRLKMQADSFLKLERECAELRRMLADAAEAI